MPQPEMEPSTLKIRKIHLVICKETEIVIQERHYRIIYDNQMVKVARDRDNFTVFRLKSQQVSYKSRVLGGVVLSEETMGDIDHRRDFTIHWDDPLAGPDLVFSSAPHSITRYYDEGQAIELGLEEVERYHIIYDDGVQADFARQENGDFDFAFTTGFYGSFHKHDDHSYSLTFKGDRLNPGEDNYDSQSKFMVSRSKYTGNLMLFLRETAIVHLR
jgi:hypothetical protein